MNVLKSMFLHAPFSVKRIMINLEAVRRDFVRRNNLYKKYKNICDFKYMMESGDRDEQHRLINELIEVTQKNVPAYKNAGYRSLCEFPLISKKELAKSYNQYINVNCKLKDCVVGHTSGSTGSAFTYYTHRQREAYAYMYTDKYIEFLGGSRNDIKARISGVNIIPAEIEKPPFWIYINFYKQLQFSSYHINENNAKAYCDAMKKYKVVYGTGYPSSWLFLAECINKLKLEAPKLKFIVTDSEGLDETQREIISKAFSCEVYRTYGLSEIGQVAVECKNKHYHLIPNYALAEIIKSKDCGLEEDIGEIVLTTICCSNTPLIRYKTGDFGILGKNDCGCGMNTQYFEKIIGRLDDYIIFSGKKIGRLDHLFKEAENIIAAQIVQEEEDEIILRFIPSNKFCVQNILDVISKAKPYLGEMRIKWEVVSELEKNKNGKVKFVIRKIKEANYV